MIADHLETLDEKVGVRAEKQLAELVKDADIAQEAANLASRQTFANEPLSEVGSSAWKALWNAAESYSKVAYPDHGWCQWVVAMSWLNASVGVR
ncbi:hypothetical protein, partial [uncultured Actinomyces sp.]|uniref:hypothetical protein n=1 Tax=uncultured Actinomyces sp. TaxID=249061 RepID=UPI0028E37283